MDGIPIFTVFCLIIYAGTTEAAAACNSVFSTSQNVQNFGYNATSETSGNEADKVFSAGWCAGNTNSPFIDVDFKQTFGISSITVARPTNQNNVYAESVMVQYVPNGGNTFEHFQIGGPLLIMSLNSSLTSTTTAFSGGIVIKKLRFTILKSVGSPCMKIDLTGCNSDLVCTGGCLNGGLCMMTDTCQCQPGYTGQNCEIKETHCVPQSLGLGNGTIKPDQITVSSEESPHTKDQLGLDNAKIGWCAGPSDPAPYVQVKLDEPKAVSIFHFGKIKRQPGEDDKFMREFELQYIAATDSAKQFRTFAQNIMAINGTHTFTIMIEPAVVTDTIRIVASRVEKRACFRLEIEGCDPKALCTPNFCMNGGTCMGENVCSCPSNYFGVRCDQTKTDIVATNLTFVSITNNVIITTSTTIHFMVTGHVTLSTIDSRPAVTINGANSYITLNSTSQGSSCITDINHCTNGYTFAVDLNFANIVDNTYILSSGGNLPGYSGVALYYSNHKLYYIVSTSTQKWTLVVNYTPIFNKWQHFEITWNPSLGVELLVNSVSLGSNSQPVQQPIANKVVELCIGCSHTTSVNVNVNMHVTGVISWTIDRTELVNAGVKPPPVTATTPHTPSTVTTVKQSTSTSTRLTSSTATPPKTPSIPVTSPTSNASSTLQTTKKETTVTPTTSMAPTTNTIPDTTTSAIPVTTAVSGGTTSTNPVTTMPLTSTLKTTATTLKESTTANVQTTSSTPKVTTEEKTTVTTPPTTTEDKVLISSTISTGQSTHFTVVDNKTTTVVTTKAPPTSAAQTSTLKPTTTVATTTPTTTTKATTTPTTTIPTTTEAPIPTFTWNFTTIVGNIIIGNTYNLTIHGTPIVINGGLQINTTTNYIEFGKHPDNVCLTNPVSCPTGLTIQFNVQFNKFSENTYFLTSGGQLPDGVGLAVIYRFGRVQFVLTTVSNSWFISVHKNTFTSNVYNNVMVSWNKTSGLELFVNNVLVIGNKIPTPHQSFLNNVTTVYIGKQPTTNIKVDFVIQTIIIWHAHIDILVEKGICQPPQRPTDAPVTTTSKPTTSKPASSAAPSASSSLTSLVTSPITTQQCPVGCVSAGPTTDKPTTEKPTTSKPTTEKPTTEKPTTAKPTTAKPTTAKPTTAKPTTTVPTTTRSTIPNFTSKPNLHVVVEKDNMAYLACVFKASMEKGVQVTAQLLVDGKMVLQKIVPGNTGLVMFSVAEVNMFMNKLEIKCTVKASFMGSSVSTQTYPSQVFIPQITVSPGTMVVVEGHTKEFFTVTSTAPPHFYCCTGCKGQCQVHIVGSFEYNRYYQKCGRDVIAQSLIEGNKPPNYNEHICGFALTATSWNVNKLYVKATIDNRRDGDHRNQMTITAQVYNQPMTAQITVKPNSFTVTTVQVTAKDNDRSVQCKSLNDPHLTTFDGKRFNNMFEGNFVLYRHKTLPFEVRANYYKCSKKSHATCNCAVSVKSGDDIISVFGCQGTVSTHPGQGHGIGLVLQQLFGSHGHAHGHGHGHDELAKTPMTIQIFKNGELTPGTYIRRYGCGQKYEIELPTGMIVTVQQSWKPFINIWIKASSSDRHNTEGLCGDNDGNSGNDVKPNVNAYNNHWKVQPNENFFYGVSASSVVVATSMYCSCVQGRNKICLEGLGVMRCSTSKYDITAALVRQAKLPILGNGNNGNNGNNRRYKRQVTNPPSTNIPVVDPDITFEEAEDRCREAILGSSVKKSCEPVLSSNFSAQIENCAHDYNATGNFEWSQDALRDIVVDCVETVNDFKAANESGNTNVTDEITLPDDLDDILLNICLEDCGEFGNCTDGVCICEPGYSGVNCSISKETVPSVSNVPYLCDITQTTDCMAAVVIGDNFVESDHLTCHFEYIEVTDTISSTGETGSSTAAYISLNQVICQLPRLRSALISVSNDGQQKSTDKTTYVAFDSVCYDCVDTNTTGPTCSRKDNNCIINDVCYAADVTKPGNNCQKCRPAVNETVWSQNDIDECKPVPVAQTTTSNDDDKTKILILAIVCGVLAAIVLIGFLCLIKAKCSKKNPKNIYGAYEITPENKFHREIATTNMAYDDKL